MAVAVVRAERALVVVRACRTAAGPAHVTSTGKRTLRITASSMAVAVMQAADALVNIVAGDTAARPTNIA